MCGREGCARRVVDLATRETVEMPTTKAARLVQGSRQADYGPPLENHDRIASFWTVRLRDKLAPGATIDPHEVAACMRLAKEARLMETVGHPDSLTDIAGYCDVEHEIHAAIARGEGR